ITQNTGDRTISSFNVNYINAFKFSNNKHNADKNI
ncbi:hypothetical protein BMETH_32801512571466, partial [methanotrophic bacterial endosymbiont of Bathymodiolus sp.]